VLAFLFFRDKPEDHGLIPDGKELSDSQRSHPETKAAKAFTLPEARKTLTFWVFAVSLLISATIVTAFTFHVVSIFTTVGLSRTQAVAIFFPSSIVAVCIQFAASWASDYIRLKYILMAHLAGMILLLCGIIFLDSGPVVLLVIVGNGLANGLFSVNGNVTWARFFGRKHLGAISGFASALIVSGSAIGPYLFSLSLEWSGSYAGACIIIGAVIVVLFFAALKANRPE
jgi:predicted MFS family arabinose efflux permease